MAGPEIAGEYNVGDDDNMGNNKRFEEIEEVIDDLEKAFEKFDNFGILKYAPWDHYFLSKGIVNKLDRRRRYLMEKMKPEWEALKLGLTNTSIYVRAYEERPDLMRAVIVGPQGTPNHLALFCFDIRFPSQYPTQPPDFFCRTYHHSSNPYSNINAKLKDFLNLNMKSHSTPMTILQLLTLIQNSFFINRPNGTLCVPARGEGPNMTVVKQTWEAMLCMLKSPPQNFEVFVQGYFRTRAHQILINFKFCIPIDETTTGLFFRLIRAFEDNGTYCQHHYNKDYFDQWLLKETLPQQKSANSGIVKKISTIFQGVLL